MSLETGPARVELPHSQSKPHALVYVTQRVGRGVEYLLAVVLALFCHFRQGEAVIVYGFYGGKAHVNLGDEAIINGMLSRISQLAHPIWLVNTEGRNDYVGVDRVFSSNQLTCHWLRWIQVIRGARICVVGGGGLFQDYGIARGTPRGIAMVQLLFWIAGRPCVWYSVGIGPLVTGQGRYFTRMAAILSMCITVRDSDSADLLRQIGVRRPIQVTADAAEDVQIRVTARALDIPQGPIRTIGVSGFGFYNVVYHDQKRNNNLVHAYASFITKCLSRGYEMKLLCMDSQQDWSFWSQVKAQLPNNGQMTGRDAEIVRTTNLEEMLYAMGTLNALMAMRFHSVLLGAKMGIPLGIVVYHPKVSSLARSMQLGHYTLALSNVSTDELMALLDQVLDQCKTLAVSELTWSSKQSLLLAQNSRVVSNALAAARRGKPSS